MSFDVKSVLTNEDMRDIVTCGFESGGYGSVRIVDYVIPSWAKKPEWAVDESEDEHPGFAWPRYGWVWAVGAIQVEDKYGDRERGVISGHTLQAGLQLLQQKWPHLAAQLLSGDYDVIAADALLQCAAFGDIIYG